MEEWKNGILEEKHRKQPFIIPL